MTSGAPPPDNAVLRSARRAAELLVRWHQGELEGAEHVPDGPALLVGNHGLFGLETPVFFWLLERATGRLPRGLADRRLFGNPLVLPLLQRVGGVPASVREALRLLRDGHLVVCYPGGAREVFKGPGQRHRLRWEKNVAFARLAIEAQVPIVPFAGVGVDDAWIHIGDAVGARRWLGRYAPPLVVGLGPVPLPAPFRFVLGRPIPPPREASRAAPLKRAVETAVLQLLGTSPTHELPADTAPVLP